MITMTPLSHPLKSPYWSWWLLLGSGGGVSAFRGIWAMWSLWQCPYLGSGTERALVFVCAGTWWIVTGSNSGRNMLGLIAGTSIRWGSRMSTLVPLITLDFSEVRERSGLWPSSAHPTQPSIYILLLRANGNKSKHCLLVPKSGPFGGFVEPSSIPLFFVTRWDKCLLKFRVCSLIGDPLFVSPSPF